MEHVGIPRVCHIPAPQRGCQGRLGTGWVRPWRGPGMLLCEVGERQKVHPSINTSTELASQPARPSVQPTMTLSSRANYSTIPLIVPIDPWNVTTPLYSGNWNKTHMCVGYWWGLGCELDWGYNRCFWLFLLGRQNSITKISCLENGNYVTTEDWNFRINSALLKINPEENRNPPPFKAGKKYSVCAHRRCCKPVFRCPPKGKRQTLKLKI